MAFDAMRSRAAIVALFLPILAAPAAYAEPAPVTAATVYPNGAWLTRTATVGPAQTRVVLDALPAGLDPSAVTVEADGAVVLGLQIEPVDAADAAAATARALLAERRTLEAELAVVEDGIELADLEIAAVRNLAEALANAGAEGLVGANLDPAQWIAQVQQLATATEPAMASKRALAVDAEELKREMERVDAALARLDVPGRSASRALIDLAPASDGSGSVVVRLSHPSPNAQWRPAYRYVLDSSDEILSFERRAQVAQRTGEPWQDIELSLSTARASRMAVVPNLPPWRVDIAKPPMPVAAEAAPDLMRTARMADIAPREETGFATRFRLTEPTNLAPDGSEVSLIFNVDTMPVDIWTTVRPSQSLEATVAVDLTAPAPEGLLFGTAQLFRDGDLVASGAIQRKAPGEALTLSFGPDDRIAVEREVLVDLRGERGLISTEVRHEYLAETRFTNRHEGPLKLRIEDRLPVPGDARITVSLHPDAGPPPDSQDAQGRVTWERTLDPGETFALRFGYRLSHPTDVTVGGFSNP